MVPDLPDKANADRVPLDATTLVFALRETLESLAEKLLAQPEDVALMKKVEGAAGIARILPFDVNVRKAQNHYYQVLQRVYPQLLQKAVAGDVNARERVDHFIALGTNLAMKVDHPALPERQMA